MSIFYISFYVSHRTSFFIIFFFLTVSSSFFRFLVLEFFIRRDPVRGVLLIDLFFNKRVVVCWIVRYKDEVKNAHVYDDGFDGA